MSEDYAERTLRAIINLGRYGELFAYDENSQMFSYENRNSNRRSRSCGLTCCAQCAAIKILQCESADGPMGDAR